MVKYEMEHMCNVNFGQLLLFMIQELVWNLPNPAEPEPNMTYC
jgi:hypothetical protein